MSQSRKCPHNDPLYYHPSREPTRHPELYAQTKKPFTPATSGRFFPAPEKPIIHSYNLRPRPGK